MAWEITILIRRRILMQNTIQTDRIKTSTLKYILILNLKILNLVYYIKNKLF